MDNNIFKATMRKITGDEQPANTMNKRAQTQPPPQQSAQPSTYNPLGERHRLLFCLGAQSCRCSPPAWCWLAMVTSPYLATGYVLKWEDFAVFGAHLPCAPRSSPDWPFLWLEQDEQAWRGERLAPVRANDPLSTGRPLTHRVAPLDFRVVKVLQRWALQLIIL